MEKVHDELAFFRSLLRNLGLQFGPRCEIVLHDFTKEYDHTITLIENGEVTGRQVGDGPTSLFFRYFKDGEHEEIAPYINHVDGRTFKSSTTLIKNEKGKVIGSVCINYDVTDFKVLENTLKTLLNGESEPQQVVERFPNKVSELLERSLEECTDMIGKPPSAMNKEEKALAIKHLDQNGVFLITKSGKRVCEYFNISKYTLYNYLDEARGTSEGKTAVP